MRKITLCIEELRVDSFGTGAQSGERGTIRAHESFDDSMDGDTSTICQIEAEASAYENAKAEAQRHQIRQETDNKVREM